MSTCIGALLLLGIPAVAVWLIIRRAHHQHLPATARPLVKVTDIPLTPAHEAAVHEPIAGLPAPVPVPPKPSTTRRRMPVYWDGRRVGWEDAAGVIHFDQKTPA
jgi:hypothetical protein